MVKTKIDNHLIDNAKVSLETYNTVQIGKEKSESFWTEKGERHGRLSPTLFSINLSNLKETLKNWQTVGVTIRSRRRGDNNKKATETKRRKDKYYGVTKKWHWEEKEIEQVKEFKYLRHTFQKTNSKKF